MFISQAKEWNKKNGKQFPVSTPQSHNASLDNGFSLFHAFRIIER